MDWFYIQEETRQNEVNTQLETTDSPGTVT